MATYGKSMTITYTAWDTSANAPKTGDSANHTLRWIKDGTAAAPTNSASEVDATNAPGEYKVTLTSAEAQTPIGKLAGASSTADVSIIPVSIAFEHIPDAAPDAAGGLPVSDAGGLDLDTLLGALNGHTAQTGDSYAIVNGDHGLVSIQDDIDTLQAKIVGTLAAGTHNPQTGDSFAITNSGTHGLAALKVLIDVIDGIVDGILIDTAEIGPAGAGFTALPWNSSWDAEVQSEVTDALNEYDPPTKAELDTGFAALNNLSASQVNDQVRDVMDTDTHAEVGQGAPPAAASYKQMLQYLYKMFRNKKTQTADTFSLYDDAGTTVDQKSTISDDGTTTTVGEMGTGP